MWSLVRKALDWLGRANPTAPVVDPEWDAHYEELRRVCAGITLRILPGAPAVPIPAYRSFGELVRVLIARDPDEFETLCPYLPAPLQDCPVCGGATSGARRLRASLQPEFENGLSFAINVWVHEECFERCPDSGEQRGIPW